MKLRDFQEHTFRLSMAWCQNPSPRTQARLVRNLERWARFTKRDGDLADYGYQNGGNEDDMWCHVSYCSDRMNQGRAKALLRLFREIP